MERLTEYTDSSPAINTRKLQFHCDVGGYIIGDIARRLAAYEDLFERLGLDIINLEQVDELSALVKAQKEGLLVVLEGITTGQANTIMGMCEQLNAMKARHGDDQEPLITWQLYNALTKSFARAGAEAVLQKGGTHEADSV